MSKSPSKIKISSTPSLKTSKRKKKVTQEFKNHNVM